MLRFHTQTGGSTLTAQQPQNNIVRTALQGLAAVLGGTQSLHTNAFDEALALPTQESARLALRTQQILAYESGAAQAVDPLAGSYFVETLTNEIELRALEYLAQIDAMGGMLRAIEGGFVQREIQNAAYEFQRAVDRREQIVVGVNAFETQPEHAAHEESPVLQRINPELERRQVERLRAFRARRDPEPAAAAVRHVEETARGGGNLMPASIEAVESQATLGEICDAMRSVFGEYREVMVI
jgi:methylmalonyl-CoA mutase N-terminal domain/subunit